MHLQFVSKLLNLINYSKAKANEQYHWLSDVLSSVTLSQVFIFSK